MYSLENHEGPSNLKANQTKHTLVPVAKPTHFFGNISILLPNYQSWGWQGQSEGQPNASFYKDDSSLKGLNNLQLGSLVGVTRNQAFWVGPIHTLNFLQAYM